jgi:hypothetical protein
MPEDFIQQGEAIKTEITFGQRMTQLKKHIDYLDSLPDKGWDDDD